MSDFFASLLRIDDFSFWIILMLLVGSATIVNVGVESKLYTSLFVPGMLFGALLALYFAREFAFSFTNHRQANIILLVAAGITCGFLATMVLIGFVQRVQELIQPSARDRRNDLKA